jgi:hypothetical protein
MKIDRLEIEVSTATSGTVSLGLTEVELTDRLQAAGVQLLSELGIPAGGFQLSRVFSQHDGYTHRQRFHYVRQQQRPGY